MRDRPQLSCKATSHNPEVAGSNPAPATEKAPETGLFRSLTRDRRAKLLPNFCLDGLVRVRHGTGVSSGRALDCVGSSENTLGQPSVWRVSGGAERQTCAADPRARPLNGT